MDRGTGIKKWSKIVLKVAFICFPFWVYFFYKSIPFFSTTEKQAGYPRRLTRMLRLFLYKANPKKVWAGQMSGPDLGRGCGPPPAGRSEVARTPGFLVPNEARYQLRYTPATSRKGDTSTIIPFPAQKSRPRSTQKETFYRPRASKIRLRTLSPIHFASSRLIPWVGTGGRTFTCTDAG